MSLRVARWLLWVLACLALPLPYFMVEIGRIPAVQLFGLAAVTVPLAITDPTFTTRLVAMLFTGQAAGYAGLLYVGAWLVAARLPAARRGAVVLGIGVGLAGLALAPVYVAPLSYGPTATNWVGIWR